MNLYQQPTKHTYMHAGVHNHPAESYSANRKRGPIGSCGRPIGSCGCTKVWTKWRPHIGQTLGVFTCQESLTIMQAQMPKSSQNDRLVELAD